MRRGAAGKVGDAALNRILRMTDGTTERSIDDATSFTAIDRRDEPCLLVRLGTAQHVDDLDQHVFTGAPALGTRSHRNAPGRMAARRSSCQRSASRRYDS